MSNGTITIDTTSPSQPTSSVTGQFTMPGGTLQLQSGTLNLAGGSTIGGTITGAGGTDLAIGAANLTTTSTVSSAGTVELVNCTEAGSYNAAGGTIAVGTAYTGPVLDLGSSLEIDGAVSFAPAVGGPVTLTTGAVTFAFEPSLSGTDSLVANGLLDLGPGSVLALSGTVDAYGGLDMDAGITINGTTLNNHGAATWDLDSPNTTLDGGAVINNLAGASFAIVGSSARMIAGDDSAVAFNNAGTLTCSTSGGANIYIPFSNTGSVDLLQDSLGLGNTNYGDTTSTGSFTGAGGTDLAIGATNLTTTSTVSSAGTVELVNCTEAGSYNAAGGTIAVGTAYTGPVLDLGSSLEIDGAVSFAPAVGGPVTLTTGAVTFAFEPSLSGTDSLVANGLLDLGPGSVLALSGTVDAYGGLDMDAGITINGTTLNNHGAATWDLDSPNTTLDGGAVINNLAGASFAIVGSSARMIAGDDSAVAFNNAGTLTCSTSGGANIYIPFSNTGSVDLLQDSLGLGNTNYGDTTSTGSFTGAGGTDLAIGATNLTTTSTVSSAGTVELVNCTEAGSYNAAGGTIAVGTAYTGPVLDLGSSLEVQGAVSFAPAVGGPVTLTTGTLTVDSDRSNLAGTDSFVANGLLTLNVSGQLSTTGSVDAYGGMVLSGDNDLTSTILNNYGAARWDVIQGSNDELFSGATINNLAGASFTVVGSNIGNELQPGDSSAVAFNNAGNFINSVSGGYFEINVPFNNTGSMNVAQGSLSLIMPQIPEQSR